MALPSEIANTVTNFSLPKVWGTQRHLRCVRIDSNGDGEQQRRLLRRFRSSELNNQNRRLKVEPLKEEEEEGIKKFTDKLMSDFRTVTDRMKESIIRKHYDEEEEEEEEEKPPEIEVSPPGEAVEVRPWNLRKRRAACKAPISGNDQSKGLGIEEKKKRVVMMKIEESAKSKSKSSKLVYTLTKKEIEDDYMNMIGQRPPRRPKKRSRTLQKQIDLLNPASYITEITEDLYEVSDTTANGKR